MSVTATVKTNTKKAMTNATPLPPDIAPTSPANRTRRESAPGTTGKRTPQERLQHEAAIRRALFASSLAAFVAIFGLIAAAGKPATAGNTLEPPSTLAPDSAYQVVAEVPLGDVTGNGGRETIVRILSPQSQSPHPHVRTRATS